MTDQAPTPPDVPPSSERPIWTRWWMIVVYVIVGLGLLGSLVGDGEGDVAPEAGGTTTTTSPLGTSTTQDPLTTTTGPPVTSTTLLPTTSSTLPPTTTTTLPIISEGVYLVGDEIQPGLYRVAGYWARLDADLEIIDNDLISDNGLSLVYVFEDDSYLEVSGEAIGFEDFPGPEGTGAIDPIMAGFTEGTYVVAGDNGDLAPGRYRVTPFDNDSSAYWARLEPNTRDIIDNGLADGQLIAILEEGEWFQFTGNLEQIEG